MLHPAAPRTDTLTPGTQVEIGIGSRGIAADVDCMDQLVLLLMLVLLALVWAWRMNWLCAMITERWFGMVCDEMEA